MILKKIDFGLAFQVVLELVRMFERMEMETMALLLVSALMIPFIVGSLWSLGIAVIWQLLVLGVKAGAVLFTVCSFIITIFRFKSGYQWKDLVRGRMGAVDTEQGETGSKPKCTLIDVVLSVFFQTGLGLPATVWDTGVDILIGNKKEKLEKKKVLMKIKVESESPSIAELLRAEMSSVFAQFQTGDNFINKTLPTSSFNEEDSSEMNEGEDLTEELNISYTDDPNLDNYLEQVVLPAAEPRRPRRRSQAAVIPCKATLRKLRKAQKNKL